MQRVILLFLSLFSSCWGIQAEKTVFLTGSCGFIGSHFLVHLFDTHPDYHFIVLDALTYAGSIDNIPDPIQKSDRFEWIHDSVLNDPLVEELMSRADYVVHFAAETHVARSIVDDFVFFETDLLGTRVLLKALVKTRQKVERFIHISTSEVYGKAEMCPMDEEHLLNPRSPYAAAKAAADRLVYAYQSTYELPTVIIRPFNNYGPRQHLEKMIPRFVSAAIERKPLIIHGDGLQERDWVYVADVCEALDKILHIEDFSKIKNQVINIGSGKGTSVLDIATLICRRFSIPMRDLLFIKDRPGQVEKQIASVQKANDLLGWSPSTELKEGLNRTIQWYLDHPEFRKEREKNAGVEIERIDGTIETY